MGIPMSTVKSVLKNQPLSKPCYPLCSHVPLDRDKFKGNDIGLVSDFQILPEKLQRIVDNGSWFWWCDVQFIPFRDDCVFAVSSSFMPRAGYTWASIPGAMNGRIQLLRLHDPENIQCTIYSRTSTTVFPKVQPHPIGQLVAYCGTGEVVVMTTEGDPLYSRSRDLSNAVHVYCAVARNGVDLAILKRGMGVYFLETCLLDSHMMGSEALRCQTVCPGFVPSRHTSEFVACKFSPDTKLIAASSSAGLLFTVKKLRLEKHLVICPQLMGAALSSAEAFDFNPRLPNEIIALGTKDLKLSLLNIKTEQVIQNFDVDETIDCVRYSPDGLSLAVGMRNFDISVFDGQELTLYHRIPMSELCQGEVSRAVPMFPTVLNLSFSQDGGFLVSSTCDGRGRIWRLPRMLSLQELCRNSILRQVHVCRVDQLKMLPDRMRDFLLYRYF